MSFKNTEILSKIANEKVKVSGKSKVSTLRTNVVIEPVAPKKTGIDAVEVIYRMYGRFLKSK